MRLWLALLVLWPSALWAACAPERAEFRDGGLSAAFRVEVVDTPESRARGLMFRERMGQFEGMLFVYERPQAVSFWMKNTLLPLDMIFMDARGVVQKVHEGAVPGDLTAIPGGRNIQYVLEVNAGVAGMLGLGPGAEMRHPSVAEAAWACEG